MPAKKKRKWSKDQRAKFADTIQAKKQRKEKSTDVVSFPLDIVPDRPRAAAKKTTAPARTRHASPQEQLLFEVVHFLGRILNGGGK